MKKAIYILQNIKRTPFPTTAGILTIIGSCLTIAITVLYFTSAYISLTNRYFHGLASYYVITAIFGVVAFTFGFMGGILALKRRRIALSVFGISLLITSGIMMSIPLWFFGLPIAILSLLSVIFVAISRSEFV
jgi:hypothetical protein